MQTSENYKHGDGDRKSSLNSQIFSIFLCVLPQRGMQKLHRYAPCTIHIMLHSIFSILSKRKKKLFLSNIIGINNLYSIKKKSYKQKTYLNILVFQDTVTHKKDYDRFSCRYRFFFCKSRKVFIRQFLDSQGGKLFGIDLFFLNYSQFFYFVILKTSFQNLHYFLIILPRNVKYNFIFHNDVSFTFT